MEMEHKPEISNNKEEEAATAHPDGQQDYNNNSNYYYSWPAIRFDVQPARTHHFRNQFRTGPNPNNFLKAVKWSPDGSCFLTSSEDNNLRIFTSPESNTGDDCIDNADDSYAASVVVNEGESVYDLCWYPYMSASDPVSCVLATTTRDHPIHLWDATTGQYTERGMYLAIRHTKLPNDEVMLRCTYRAYDAMDEISAAFSVAFNPSGTKIFSGYNKAIRVFDVHRPGRDFQQYSTVQGKKEGQAGIISAIAFSPAQSGMLATGSYSQTTAIYNEDNMELLYVLHGQEGGVTHVQFSNDGNYVYTGGRKDPYILCWDIRKAVDVVYKLYRSTESTNQRILFDIEPNGQHLATGGQDGYVHIYNLQTGLWTSSFQAAMDTVNGVSFHPYLPIAATSSGHRRYEVPDEGDAEMHLNDFENCASLWSFFYDSMGEAHLAENGQSEQDDTHQET